MHKSWAYFPGHRVVIGGGVLWIQLSHFFLHEVANEIQEGCPAGVGIY
jgi:hypothetical protein